MRHGKSSWKHDVEDRERPLKSRGLRDSELVAKQLIRKVNLPERIFSSPAKRALNTCKNVLKTLQTSDKDVVVDEDLYDFHGESVINFLKKLPDDYHEVMIFGHNHAFTSISNIFGDRLIENLPTSGLVKINIDIQNWKDLKQGTTEFIIIPKELK